MGSVSVNPFRFFVGLGLTIAGFASGNPQLKLLGISLAVGAFGLRLAQKLDGLANQQVDTTVPVGVVYGEVKVGAKSPGLFVIETQSNRRAAVFVAPWCHGSTDGGDIEAVRSVYFENEHAIDGIVDPRGTVDPDFLANGTDIHRPSLDLTKHLGSYQQGADSVLRNYFPDIFAATAYGRGVAYSTFILVANPDGFFRDGAVPVAHAIIRGRRVYDTRSATWAWSQNPAMCLRDYLLDPVAGPGYLASDIDNASFEAVADYYDESIDFPISGGGVRTGARGECNIELDPSRGWKENVREILRSFRMELIPQGGQWRLVVRRNGILPVDTSIFEVNRSTIVGDLEHSTVGLKTGANIVHGSYVERARNWTVNTIHWPPDDDTNPYLAADNGVPSPLDVDLPAVSDYFQATAISRISLVETRYADTWQCTLQDSAIVLQVGDLVWVDHPLVQPDNPGSTRVRAWVMDLAIRQDARVDVVLMRYNPNAYLDLGPAGVTIPNPTFYPFDLTIPSLNLPSTASPSIASVSATIVQAGAFGASAGLAVTLDPDTIEPGPELYEVEWREDSAPGPWRPGGTVRHPFYEWDDPAPSVSLDFATPGIADTTLRIRARTVYEDGRKSAWVEDTATVSRTPPNGGVGTPTATTRNGVVYLTFPTTGTGGTIFNAYVGAAGFSVVPAAKLDGPRLVKIDDDVTFAFVPPVAAGESFEVVVGVADALTDVLGEAEALSARFSFTYDGFNVTVDPSATSCENILSIADPRCAPADGSDTAAEASGNPWTVDLDAYCVPVGGKLSVGVDGWIVCAGSSPIATSPGGNLALVEDGKVCDFDFEDGSIIFLDPAVFEWSGATLNAAGYVELAADGFLAAKVATETELLVAAVLQTDVGVDGRDIGAAAISDVGGVADTDNLVLTMVRRITGGNNHWNDGKIVGGTYFTLRANQIGSAAKEYYATAVVPDLPNVDVFSQNPGDDWLSSYQNDSDFVGKVFRPGIYSLGNGVTNGRCYRLQASRGRTVSVANLSNHKLRCSRTGDAYATDRTKTTAAQSGTGTISFDTNDDGCFWHKIEVLDASAGDAVVATWTPARGVWGGDVFDFEPSTVSCSNIFATVAAQFFEDDGTTPVGAAVEPTGTNLPTPGERITIDGALALTRPSGARYLHVTPWKRGAGNGHTCFDNPKVNTGTVATPFSTPRALATTTLGGIPTTAGDPGSTATGGTGNAVPVSTSEKVAISKTGANLLGRGDIDSTPESLASSDASSRKTWLALADVLVSPGEDISFAVYLASSGGSDRLRAMVEFLDSSGMTVGLTPGADVTASSPTKATVETVVPPNATVVRTYAENRDGTEAWTLRDRALWQGPYARDRGPAPIWSRHRDLGDVSGAVELDFGSYRTISFVATGAVELTVRGVAAGGDYGAFMRQDATGGRAISFTGIAWAGKTPPTFSTDGHALDVVGFVGDGTVVVAADVAIDAETPEVTIVSAPAVVTAEGQDVGLFPIESSPAVVTASGGDSAIADGVEATAIGSSPAVVSADGGANGYVEVVSAPATVAALGYDSTLITLLEPTTITSGPAVVTAQGQESDVQVT